MRPRQRPPALERPWEAALIAVWSLPLADLLPDSSTPYGIAIGVGFALGIYGHLGRFRWLVALSIAIVFSAAILALIAGRTMSGAPPNVELP